MISIMNKEEYLLQEKELDSNLQQLLQILQNKDYQLLKNLHNIFYEKYQQKIVLNWKREYREQKGWGIVKPIIDLKRIAPLCRFPFGKKNLDGCYFCNKKRYWYEIIDTNQPIWALYFSMNLAPLWTKLRERWPHWTELQVQNNRYWRATKHKLLKKLEQEFLKEHPGPWCRVLNRAYSYQDEKTNKWIYCPHTTYTFGIWYSKTMEQIEIYMRWPPEPYPLTIQFLGRPKSEINFQNNLWDNFILE